MNNLEKQQSINEICTTIEDQETKESLFQNRISEQENFSLKTGNNNKGFFSFNMINGQIDGSNNNDQRLIKSNISQRYTNQSTNSAEKKNKKNKKKLIIQPMKGKLTLKEIQNQKNCCYGTHLELKNLHDKVAYYNINSFENYLQLSVYTPQKEKQRARKEREEQKKLNKQDKIQKQQLKNIRKSNDSNIKQGKEALQKNNNSSNLLGSFSSQDNLSPKKSCLKKTGSFERDAISIPANQGINKQNQTSENIGIVNIQHLDKNENQSKQNQQSLYDENDKQQQQNVIKSFNSQESPLRKSVNFADNVEVFKVDCWKKYNTCYQDNFIQDESRCTIF